MEKKQCSICGKKFKLGVFVYPFKDGIACFSCTVKAGGTIKKDDTLENIKAKIDGKLNTKPTNYNSIQKYDNMRKSILYDESTEYGKRNILRDKLDKELFELQHKYSSLIQQHYNYENTIEETYKLAIYQDNIDNDFTRKCEEQCALDIKLSEELIPYYKKEIELRNKMWNFGIVGLPIYIAYTRYAQLCEKRKDYLSAVSICNMAIKNGYTNENGNNDIFIRKARLQKKIKNNLKITNKKNNVNYKYVPEQNIIIDDDTGQIIE